VIVEENLLLGISIERFFGWKVEKEYRLTLTLYELFNVSLLILCYYKSCKFVRGNLGFGSACHAQFISGNVG